MKNKRLDDGWISEQLKDRWMDQGAIEGTMDSASGGWIRETLDGATDCSALLLCFFLIC